MRKLFFFLILLSSSIYSAERILIVVTNHSQLGNTGVKTGYYLSEVSHPYNNFTNNGFKVDFASPNGGFAPMDPKSRDLQDPLNKKFLSNKEAINSLKNTISLSNINPKLYKAIIFAGGHGAMWDFPNSKALNRVTADIYEAGGVVAAVCHGPAALVNVKLSNGKSLVTGKKVTGFSNEEESVVKLTKVMPFLLETKLKERGAIFFNNKPFEEKVVVDSRLVTGQNPASASKLSKEVIKIIKNAN